MEIHFLAVNGKMPILSKVEKVFSAVKNVLESEQKSGMLKGRTRS